MTIKAGAVTISSTNPGCFKRCAARGVKCEECVNIQGRPTEFVPEEKK